MGLLFCGLGDISLMFSDSNISQPGKLLFIIGGTSFFIGRAVITLAFIIYPYRNKPDKRIDFTVIKIVFMLIIPITYTTWMIIYFCIVVKDNMMVSMLSIYIFLMGIQLFFSMFRLKGFNDESLIPQVLGVSGTILFNISDTLLFWNIFIYPIPYGNIISILFYWLGIYLLTISIVRNNNFDIEKGNDNLYFNNIIDYNNIFYS